MDKNKLVEVLRVTLDPNQGEEAEQQLEIVHKMVGFTPILLQVVVEESIDMLVRQAGAIHLKNMCNQFWIEKEVEKPTDPVPFNIHERDRFATRGSIIEAVIHASDPVRVQLCMCISTMIRYDYPDRWPDFTEKVTMYIKSDNNTKWMGAFLCLYQLVKVYKYRCNERKILDNAMIHILPLCYQRYVQLMQDPSEASNLLQKQILKIYYAFIQNSLPLETVTKETFTQWMELIMQTVDRPVPETNHIEVKERPELAWWKVKKWAMHLLTRTFERYGSPGHVTVDYNHFSEWYLKAFSGEVIQVLFKIFDQYRQKIYIAPRVLQQALNFLSQGISHAFAWEFIKPHIHPIIQEVIFPLMCHSDSDEELWQSDPQEYIRLKYDVSKHNLSPVIAAQVLFYSCASKGKKVLKKSMDFCMQILNQGTSTPRQKDGALHMIGSVSHMLLKRHIHKDMVEMMLFKHVCPDLTSPHGYLRSRACWVIRVFSDMKYMAFGNQYQALELIKNCLCNDKELPVKVEAAIALQMLMIHKHSAFHFMQPHVETVIRKLLNVMRETENENLMNTVELFVHLFVKEVKPLAVEMISHLATTFSRVLERDCNESEDQAVVARSILNTMESIVDIMKEQKEFMLQWECIMLDVVRLFLQKRLLDFYVAHIYEKVLSLIYSLTSSHITMHMWQVFDLLYKIFKKDGIDNFQDMMPVLHNYITVDTPAFLSSPNHLEAVYNMCKQVLAADKGENGQCHAAKLLEVILIQCPGQVDSIVRPFVELVFERLTRKVLMSELRTMCLQVVIAALYYNTPLLIETLKSMDIVGVQDSMMQQFLKQWIRDVNCFLELHDRKICTLGMCKLLNLMDATRPAEVTEVGAQILPYTLSMFQGLKMAYGREYKNAMASDKNEVDDDGLQYLEMLEKYANSESDSNGDDSYDDDLYGDDKAEERALASYQTPFDKMDCDVDEDNAEDRALESYQTLLDKVDCDVDEFVIFKEIMQNLLSTDPAWYGIITSQLTPEQTKTLEDVFKLAEQRKLAAEIGKVDRSFAAVTVP